MKKNCRQCDVSKPLTFFYKNKATPDGYMALCKKCERGRVKEVQGFNKKLERREKKRYIERQIAPVSHLSYSAVRTFMVSPAKFLRDYISRSDRPFIMTMAAGSAWHKGLELLFQDVDDWKTIASTQLATEANKKGDLTPAGAEELAKEMIRLEDNFEIYEQYYRNGELEWTPRLMEQMAVLPCPIEGGLKMKGVIDVIPVENAVIDHKYVKRFNPAPDNSYYVQAWFYYHIYHSIVGKYPDYFCISEFKKIPNRDKSPQLRQRIIVYDQKWLGKVGRWYKSVSDQIKYQMEYPANPFFPFGADDWDSYLKT